jgi:hypothetical protein
LSKQEGGEHMGPPIAERVISAPINEFCVLSGLGRTKIYELLNTGDLASIKIGNRRLILLDSYRQLIDRRRVPA